MPDERPVILMIERHHQPLSEEETNELISAMAELVVNFMKRKRDPEQAAERRQEHTHERIDSPEVESR